MLLYFVAKVPGYSLKNLFHLSITTKSYIKRKLHHILVFFAALPQIYLHPLDKSVKVDNDSTSVTFICMAYYASSYYWLRETGDIPSNAMGVNSNTLTLHNILPPDSGRYQCVAENEHESTHSNYAMLIVEGT